MIVENKYLEEIRKIWEDNNSGYISKDSNEILIKNNDILKIVYLEDKVPAGYVGIYTKNDFCSVEGYPDKIDKNDKVVYIWEIIIDKKFAGKGIASKLIEYVLNKYKNYKVYSCINKNNTPSLNLHKKYGFKDAYQFKDEKDKEQIMLVKIN